MKIVVLFYDPVKCDWCDVIQAFYSSNPDARGQVTLILKPKACIKKGLKNASFCNEKTAESIIDKRY